MLRKKGMRRVAIQCFNGSDEYCLHNLTSIENRVPTLQWDMITTDDLLPLGPPYKVDNGYQACNGVEPIQRCQQLLTTHQPEDYSQSLCP
ncbi:hypothetical protein V6N13_059762 [Hibiscus sabdariffa]